MTDSSKADLVGASSTSEQEFRDTASPRIIRFENIFFIVFILRN
jgi:hypothetical protein